MTDNASNNKHPAADPRPVPLWMKWAGGVAAVFALLVAVVVLFPWDLLRGPLNRYVSDKTGRHFEITRKLDVKLGRTTRILADGIEFANPQWAQDRHLVTAQAAEIDIRLWPLLQGRVVLPMVKLTQPKIGLQVEADGRRSWALGRDTSDPSNLPDIGALVVDEGSVHYLAKHQGADILTDFVISESMAPSIAVSATATGAASGALPLSFKSRGTWKSQPFTAAGRTGNVVYLSEPLKSPFPAQVKATAGGTTLTANGSIASLQTLDGANAAFTLQGANLADLYKLVGVVLPETPRYSLAGNLSKEGQVWQVRKINGKLGNSDLAGDLAFDRSQAVAQLTGQLQSKAMDFDDLAPLVGLPEQPRSAAALPQVAAPAASARARARAATPASKVLPTATLDLARLKAMNADVKYTAVKITNVRGLPLDRMSVQIGLKDGVLRLDPMDLGLAGGKMVGRLSIDGNSNPAVVQVRLDGRALELNKLFPGFKLTQASFGKVHGLIDLKGSGNSAATMLASSSGNVALLMGKGQISNLLLEFAGLDGGEIIKFMIGGDKNVNLRCAATAFDVNKGLMTARAFVIDTEDTVIYGTGGISLANETIDLTLKPLPKDSSILSLRSPLKLAGSFSSPKAGVDKAALGGRAGIALALAAINPLLALAATIETGPGQDANCRQVLREAAAPEAQARINATAPPPAGGMGGGIAPAPASANAPAANATTGRNPPAPAVTRSGAHYPLDTPARKP